MKSQKNNKVSVVIPCYNDGKYLSEAVKSVEKCDKVAYEIIIVDDGSTDQETIKVLDNLSNQGYYVIRIKHQGQSAARNRGVKAAKYPYLMFLDSDDFVFSDYLTDGISILDKNPEIGAVYGDIEFRGLKKGIGRQIDFDANEAFFTNTFGVCCLVRKKVWQDCKGFDTNMDFWEDWEFFLNAYKHGWKFFHIPKVLFRYRIRKKSVNSRRLKRENRLRILHYVYKKHFDFFIKIIEEIVARYGLKGKINAVYSLLSDEKERNIKLLEAQKKLLIKLKTEKNKNIELAKKINSIEQAFIWNFFRKYQKLENIFLPAGTRRKKIHEKAIFLIRKIFAGKD